MILPVSVKLDGKVSHDTHSFISEGHLHLDDPSTAGKRAGYLQTFGLHGWKPNLNINKISSFISDPATAVTLFCSSVDPRLSRLTDLGGL